MTVLASNSESMVNPARTRPPFAGAYRGLVNLLRLGLDESEGQRDPSATLDGIIPRHVLRRLLSALQFRDPGTVRHGRRVALLAVGLAEHLGWDGRQLKVLEVASLLHDVGKLGVPDTVLFKPAKLSEDELELMALHYGIVLDLLQACRVDPEVLQIVSQSQVTHAGIDGIKRLNYSPHLGARILAVADAYESLSAARTYRGARNHDEIMEILEDGIGRRFDGNVVSALARHVSLHGLPFADHEGELDDDARRHGPESIDDLHDVNELCYIVSNLYILESLYDGFFLLDADYRVRCWNRGAECLLGYPLMEMYGQPWSKRLKSVDDNLDGMANGVSGTTSLMEQATRTGRPVVAQLGMTRADGRQLEIETQVVPLMNDEGHLLGILQILRDLTRSGRRRTGELAELKLAASRDALTGLANRGELEVQMSKLVIDYARDQNRPFSVIFADADHFKNINDTHGHSVGDQVLIDLSRLLEQETYSGELVGRYGGEEFVILCPDTKLDEAIRRAERIRHSIELSQVGGVANLRVTASFGASQVEPGDTIEKVLRRADLALYQAKHTGRNRTCFLTSNHLGKDPTSADAAPAPPQPPAPFEYFTTFTADVAADMIVYKLGGFVTDNYAQLLDVTTTRVRLHAGRQTLFGFWGSLPKHQPVELEITFDDRSPESKSGRRASSKCNFQVKVRPLGWIRKQDVFQARALRITQELRHYFAGV
jgi:diguanylate cyclase (GGDEF)-like protein/PAS domain S-box-containing protein